MINEQSEFDMDFIKELLNKAKVFKGRAFNTMCMTLLFILISPTVSANLDNDIKLFKNYYYGTHIANFRESKGYYDCSLELKNNAVCLSGVDFTDTSFELALIYEDKKVVGVTLFNLFTNELHQKLFANLIRGFNMSAIQGKDELFDIISKSKSESENNFTDELVKFENTALHQGEISYIFIEKHANFANADDYTSAIVSTPKNIRAIVYNITTVEGNSYIRLSFTLPQMDLKRQRANFLNAKEDF
ncbi:hypothetical protein ACSFVZ_19830 [Pseudoalteromonas sp. SYSU M81236]|uniref:hypothetical protein n=1 Tax=Pseudoalteromonas sp. SYSU M81236 TaxID=3447014 RepID=UPI003F077234